MFGFSSFAEVPFADIPATTPSGINYSLTCAVGSYSVTGKTATFSLSKKLTASTGSYSVTGKAATFSYVHGNVNYTLACAVGSYAVTGKNATLTYTAGHVNYALTCSTGSYAVTGIASTLTVAHKLTATAGAYSVTGKTATFSLAKKLTAAAGIYAVTGQTATFTYTAGQINYTLTCAVGSYAVTGKNATLTYVNNGQIPVTKGGIGKSKIYKNSRKEVEEDIARAIVKVTGEDEELALVTHSADNSLEAEIKVAEEANIVKLQEMVMQAQAMALQAEIDRLIQDELDDEESLMLLL
jgi:hypothetical protein